MNIIYPLYNLNDEDFENDIEGGQFKATIHRVNYLKKRG